MSLALIFDMDGVLADTEGLIAEATIGMFKDLYGVDLTPEDFRPYIGTGARRYVEGPALDHGISIDLDAALERRHDNFVALLDAGCCERFPGALELIEAARADNHWRVAIATSSPREKARATLKAIGIDPAALDGWVTGDDVEHKKPHPEIYLKTAGILGLRPADCVVVEDAVQGVLAAKAAGMACVGITNSFDESDLAGADLIVSSLEELSLVRLQALVGPA